MHIHAWCDRCGDVQLVEQLSNRCDGAAVVGGRARQAGPCGSGVDGSLCSRDGELHHERGGRVDLRSAAGSERGCHGGVCALRRRLAARLRLLLGGAGGDGACSAALRCCCGAVSSASPGALAESVAGGWASSRSALELASVSVALGVCCSPAGGDRWGAGEEDSVGAAVAGRSAVARAGGAVEALVRLLGWAPPSSLPDTATSSAAAALAALAALPCRRLASRWRRLLPRAVSKPSSIGVVGGGEEEAGSFISSVSSSLLLSLLSLSVSSTSLFPAAVSLPPDCGDGVGELSIGLAVDALLGE